MLIAANHIYQIDDDCLSLQADVVAGQNNLIRDNRIHDCADRGIFVNGGSGVGSNNQLIGNQVWNTGAEGVVAARQTDLLVQDNIISATATTHQTFSGGGGLVLSTIQSSASGATNVWNNYLFGNGTNSAYSYAGAMQIRNAGGVLVITGTRLTDAFGSGLVFAGSSALAPLLPWQTIHSNAICTVNPYEINNADAGLSVLAPATGWAQTPPWPALNTPARSASAPPSA